MSEVHYCNPEFGCDCAKRIAELERQIEILSTVREVTRVELRPGDKLIAHTDRLLTGEQCDRLRDQINQHFPDHEVVIAAGGVRLTVVSG